MKLGRRSSKEKSIQEGCRFRRFDCALIELNTKKTGENRTETHSSHREHCRNAGENVGSM